MNRIHLVADRTPGGRPGPRGVVLGALATIAILAAGAVTVMGLSGCVRQSGARAESREVRLTRDGVHKSSPRFSPDGKSVAFARRVGEGEGMVAVFVIPAGGGPERRISPDTLGLQPLRWSSDGQAVYCVSLDGRTLYRLGLDRSVRVVSTSGTLSRFYDVSADGETQLLLTFNRDNYDVSMRRGGGREETLGETPEWENGCAFGPGSDQVTVVGAATFQSPLNTISVRSLDARVVKPLPLPEGLKYSPTWSPDGRHLAYVVSSNGQLDVWLYDPAAARAFPAIQDPQDSSAPAWSPDGDWLAFCRAVRTSYLFAGEPGTPDRRQLTHGPANDYDPMVSPDGKWIAFLRRPAPGTEGADTPVLCLMPASGGAVKVLDLQGRKLATKGSEIVWSHDSEYLAFSAREASTGLDVYRVRRDGTGLMRVTVEAGDEIDPRWSPDGRQIAYTRVGGGRTQVAVLPSNGGVARVISDERVVSEGGTWSPDGQELAYMAVRGEGQGYELWIASPSAPERRRRVLADATVAWPVHWVPEGRQLLVVRGKGANWYVSEFDPPSGKERRIATEVMLPSGGMYHRFLPEGEKYRQVLQPGGAIMADGQQTADLYMIRTRDLVRPRQLSEGGQGVSWLARVGWVASY